MRKYWPTVLLVSIAMATPIAAQEQAAAQAATAEVKVGTAVVDREISGEADTFAADAGRLYCFSRVSNAADSEIEHVWYKDDAEVARVKLRVGGSPWRTHSSKRLGENPAGNWRCDVVKDGTVLKSVNFKVQ
jgi:hypothetical protein